MPVARIAAHVGFADPRYFRRIFLRHVGVTPAQYRMLFP
jgi:AraC-like DNA-binding protein